MGLSGLGFGGTFPFTEVSGFLGGGGAVLVLVLAGGGTGPNSRLEFNVGSRENMRPNNRTR